MSQGAVFARKNHRNERIFLNKPVLQKSTPSWIDQRSSIAEKKYNNIVRSSIKMTLFVVPQNFYKEV